MAKKLRFEIEVDDNGTAKVRKFERSIDKTERSGTKFGHTVGGLSRKLSKFTLNAGRAALKVGALGAAAGMMAGMYALAKGIKAATSAAMVQRDAEAKLGAVLKSTGDAAGYNLEQLKRMASGLQKITTYGDEAVLSGMAILATFKNIRGEAFERTTKAALDMSTIMGTDLKSSMLMLGKALNDPVTNLSALTRAGVQFNEEQKEMIKELAASGELMAAQSIILKELESQFGGAAEAAGGPFAKAMGQLKNVWGDLLEEIGFAIVDNEAFVDLLDEMKGIITELIPYVGDLVDDFVAWIGPADQLRAKLDMFLKTVKKMIWPLKQLWNLMKLVGKGIGVGAAKLVTAAENAPSMFDSQQSGTGPGGLSHTGLFMGHKGEIVKNPAESDAERRGGNGGNGRGDIHFHLETLVSDPTSLRNAAQIFNREFNALNARWGTT